MNAASVLTILVVEDNAGDFLLIQQMLFEIKDFSKTIVHADNLQLAIEATKANQVDVILLDLSLTDSYGIDSFLKLSEIVPQTPILILSGLNDKTFAKDAVKNGAQDYLVKGEFEEKLLSQLNDDDLKQIQKGQLSDTEEMKNIAYDQLGLQGQMVAQQVALNNSISMLIATTDMGNDFLKVAQVTQTKNLGLEKTGEQQNTLDLLNANNKETVAALNMMGGDIQNLFNSLKGGTAQEMFDAFKTFGERFANVTGDVAKTQFQNLTFGDLMTTAVTKFATSADSFSKILETFKTLIGVKDSIITPDGVVTPLEQDSIITMTQGEKFKENLLGKGTPQPNQTAMIDKETMMSSPQSKNNTTNNSKIEIAFTHESKGANINVAQEFSKSLRDNTSLQQQLVQQISENIKNYGLTA
jgi:response regulator of citrate/malate metabolism